MTPHLLVIDDEPMLRRMLSRLLSPSYQVTLAEGSSAALELIHGGARFDLIVCDVMMPGGTGIDFLDRLNERDAEQARRLVFLTSGAIGDTAEQLDRVTNPVLEKARLPAELQSDIAGALAALAA